MSAINCSDVATVDRSNLIISVIIACGIVASYIPQHMRIHRRRSSEGLSPFFLLLGVTSCTNSLINIAVLQWNVLRCCSSLSLGICLANSLGVIQLLLQWAMFTTTLILFLIYFPRPNYFPVTSGRVPVAKPIPRHTSLGWSLSLAVSIVAIIHLISFSAVSLSFLRKSATREKAILWANWLGASAMVLSALQYLPQLWTTYRKGSVGSLSLLTLAVQAPGSFVFAYSIAQRPGTRWSSWVLFVVTGCLQFILAGLCVYFRSKHRFHWGERSQIRREQAQQREDDDEDARVGLLEEQTGEGSTDEDENDVVVRHHSGYVD